ncbi:MAG TPA: hypothetical protein VK477_08475, partial [Acidobacteriota bacterium]|nr:hypothetical protein [Acidobacteriota bacterium]
MSRMPPATDNGSFGELALRAAIPLRGGRRWDSSDRTGAANRGNEKGASRDASASKLKLTGRLSP